MRAYSGHFALVEGADEDVKVHLQSNGAAHPGALTEESLWLHQKSFNVELHRDKEIGPTKGTAVQAADLEWKPQTLIATRRKPVRPAMVTAGRRSRPGNDASMSLPPNNLRTLAQHIKKNKLGVFRFALAYFL